MLSVPCHHGRRFAVDPARTALMVIDMQRAFLDPEGALGVAGADVAPLAAVVPTVRRVLDAARARGLAVIHTREGHRPDLCDLTDAKREQYAQSGIEIGAGGPLGRHFVRGEPGHEIVAELAPLAGEPVVDKPGFGAFHATDLAAILAARGIERLVLTGVTTQCCVHSTLREAVDRGFRCLTVADASATQHAGLQEATLAIIASGGHLFGEIADAEAVIDALG